jgi:N-acetylneuraminate synthase
MQCASLYPCPPESVGLNMLETFRQRYGCAVGLSDHSGTIYPSLAAVTLRAQVIETHVTLSREMFGPDVVVSLTTPELKSLVDGVRFIERMLASPVDKARAAEEVAPLRQVFMKSVVAACDLPGGTVLRPEHLASKKPGTGIPTARLPELLGQRLRRAVQRNELIRHEDLERA